MEEHKKSLRKYKLGALVLSEWGNNFEGKIIKSYSFQRSYKDKEDKWQHTTNLRDQDLLNLSILLNKVISSKVSINDK